MYGRESRRRNEQNRPTRKGNHCREPDRQDLRPLPPLPSVPLTLPLSPQGLTLGLNCPSESRTCYGPPLYIILVEFTQLLGTCFIFSNAMIGTEWQVVVSCNLVLTIIKYVVLSGNPSLVAKIINKSIKATATTRLKHYKWYALDAKILESRGEEWRESEREVESGQPSPPRPPSLAKRYICHTCSLLPLSSKKKRFPCLPRVRGDSLGVADPSKPHHLHQKKYIIPIIKVRLPLFS